MKTVLGLLAAATIIALICAVAFCWTNDIRSRSDLNNYREMIACGHPVVEALAEGNVYEGMPESDLLSIRKPEWTLTYGCYSTFGFTHRESSDYVTISTMNRRVCAAHAGSCTWRWTYFAHTPKDVIDIVQTIHAIEEVIAKSPNTENALRPLLQAQYAKLGVHPQAIPDDSDLPSPTTKPE